MTRPLILIADDTPTNLQLLVHALNADYRIKIATNGTLALELAQLTDRPDLILLDIMMPDLNGYEVCKQLKSQDNTRHIPIIFITSLGSVENEELGLNLGAVDYITKPFAMPIVRARIRNHIALKKSNDMLEHLAYLDGLTCIANRRHFDRALDTEWKRACRQQLPLALVMADVDEFKRYNDHYGHGRGDECLVRVSRLLTHSLERPSDLAARYGGEEFVMLLPETDAAGAAAVAERFRAHVHAQNMPHVPGAKHPCLTVSVGYASVVPSPDMSPESLLQLADQALYVAKAAGRNRVHP